MRKDRSAWYSGQDRSILFSHKVESFLKFLDHQLFDDQTSIIKVLDDSIVPKLGAVNVHEDGLDSRFALDEHACFKLVFTSHKDPTLGNYLPRIALGILNDDYC